MLCEINTPILSSHRKSVAQGFHAQVSVDSVLSTLTELGISFRIRIFDPLTTLLAFLTQIFSDDSSCRNAVASVIAARKAQDLPACCFNTGSLSKAKARLPIALFSTVAKKAAIIAEKDWKHGRVIVVDGTGVSMPDTKANKNSFPLRMTNMNGFPGARIAALFSLSSGALIDLALAPMKGKGTGETTLLKRIWHNLKAGDTLLGDSLFSNYGILSHAQKHGIHVVSELRPSRCKRLKKKQYDQVIELKKIGPLPMHTSREEFDKWPDSVQVRIIKIKCAPKGFRPKVKYILTNLLDRRTTTAEKIMDLYKCRWQVELNLRSIKTTLGMDVLRGLTPAMVEKEIWVYALAYNLIRAVIYAAGILKQIPPMCLSFRAAQQLFNLFRTGNISSTTRSSSLGEEFLELIASQVVGTRPDRYEPRVIKRRQKNYTLMSGSRTSAKRRLHKKWK